VYLYLDKTTNWDIEIASANSLRLFRSLTGETNVRTETEGRFFGRQEDYPSSFQIEFPEVGNGGIGIRKDWQIVLIDSRVEAKKEIAEMLEHIFS
jgi:hypothetical protein